MVKCKRLKPQELNDKVKQEVIILHQKHFDLKPAVIIKYLEPRDYVDVYFNKKGKVIATVGVQWYKSQGNHLVYIGNVVVDSKYQRCGLATRSFFIALMKTVFKFPLQSKFVAILTTSPNIYAHISKLKDSWPKPYEKIPVEINQIMQQFLQANYPDNHLFVDDFYLVSPKKGAEIEAISYDKKHDNFYGLWYSLANFNYKRGFQLPVVAKINKKNLWITFKFITRITHLWRKIRQAKPYLLQIKTKDVVYIGLLGASIYYCLVAN